MTVVTVLSRGQIVIPKDIRKLLHILPGKKLPIKAEEDHGIIRPLPDDPVEHLCGFFKGGSSLTKALLDERQRDRNREWKKMAP